MKAKALLILCSGLLLMQTVAAEPDPANGQKLFAASKCLNCHGTDAFTKADRKVTDLARLESQVRSCDANLDTNWFDDEIKDVVAYLNQAYYKF
ncbi:MAG: cytochrome c [Candidatus Thiothrix putei]|uniref:Cytochrome c n=1 Tax=Candidatus Thiothrix putei TaxID=3080811 RepID=A0AA95HG42_9GAMM|nr:MAG: cytochrome c [Candidatus Thiothrix putei]